VKSGYHSKLLEIRKFINFKYIKYILFVCKQAHRDYELKKCGVYLKKSSMSRDEKVHNQLKIETKTSPI